MGRKALPFNSKIWLPAGYPEFEEVLRQHLALAAGGYTEYEALGGWKDSEDVTKEPVKVFEAFYDEAARSDVERLLENVAADLIVAGESAVLISINGGAWLVS